MRHIIRRISRLISLPEYSLFRKTFTVDTGEEWAEATVERYDTDGEYHVFTVSVSRLFDGPVKLLLSDGSEPLGSNVVRRPPGSTNIYVKRQQELLPGTYELEAWDETDVTTKPKTDSDRSASVTVSAGDSLPDVNEKLNAALYGR